MELYKIKQLNAYTWVIAEDLDVMVDTMYLVVGSRKAALIDTGAGIGDLRGLVESLTELPVMVLTTHLHTDHAGGNPLFEEIYVSEADAFLMPESMSLDYRMNFLRGSLWNNPEKLAEIDRGINRITEFDFQPLNDGDVFDLGGVTLRTIAFPGHTPGSVMFYDEGSGILFSGDSINTTPWLFLPYSTPIRLYLQKLEELKPQILRAGQIYCGHSMEALGAKTVPDLEQACRELMDGAQGKPVHTVAGDAWKYRSGCVQVFYQPDQI